jgi:hypothetical protein
VLSRTVQDFLSEAAGAVVLENGAVAFDLGPSKYSIFRGIQQMPASRGASGISPTANCRLRSRCFIISPEIDWKFVGIDEHWREGVKVVFRKRPGARSRSRSGNQKVR